MALNLALTGATGLVGEGVLLTLLDRPEVGRIVVVGRRACGHRHAKLEEVLVPDFGALGEARERLRGLDGCLYCAGISSVGLSEEQYTQVTVETPLALARVLLELNPGMTFCHISGQSTDGTGEGRVMWARVKGRAERALSALPFRAVYHFRPGLMRPLERQVHVRRRYRILGGLVRLIPRAGLRMEQVALAMLRAVEGRAERSVLEMREMRRLAE